MNKRTLIFLSLVTAVIAGLGIIKLLQIRQGMAMMANAGPPPTAVEVTPARLANWQPRVSAVGTLTAKEGIDVSTEVEGLVETIHFKSGMRVAKDDLLVNLNDDEEQAELVRLKAQEELARTLFKRNESMWRKKTISETNYDQARADLKIVRASVAATRARIAKKTIRAPFSGVLGIRHVNTGQYVSAGNRIVSLQDYSSLYIDFAIPEKYLPDIGAGLKVNIHVSAYPERVFSGEVSAIDAKVDEATRNISLRARLENKDNLLRPGMYADISLLLDKPAERIVVPATSIVFSSFGNALFIASKNEQGTLVAQRVSVVSGEQRGDEVAILSGLKGDEQVVSAGVAKLRNNAPIAINKQARLKVNGPVNQVNQEGAE